MFTLEVLRLSSETPTKWTSLAVFTEDAKVRAEPFEHVELELELDVLWPQDEVWPLTRASARSTSGQ